MTDDELVGRMFDEVKAVSVRTVNSKRFISDKEALAKMEFQEACAALVEAEQRWAEIDPRRRSGGRTRTATRRRVGQSAGGAASLRVWRF